ncbi:MAG: hypothetical protein ACRD36_07965 [Candidatus Acidiferrum sp.]
MRGRGTLLCLPECIFGNLRPGKFRQTKFAHLTPKDLPQAFDMVCKRLHSCFALMCSWGMQSNFLTGNPGSPQQLLALGVLVFGIADSRGTGANQFIPPLRFHIELLVEELIVVTDGRLDRIAPALGNRNRCGLNREEGPLFRRQEFAINFDAGQALYNRQLMKLVQVHRRLLKLAVTTGCRAGTKIGVANATLRRSLAAGPSRERR